MPRRHDPSRRYHNRIARQYDAIYDDPYWHFHDELTWRLIKPHLPRNTSARCADLGCGSGKWGLKLLKSGFATTFVDHSAAMIAQVRDKLGSPGSRASRATLVTADIVQMDQVSAEQFALVLAMGDVLSICSSPLRAAHEIHRIASPGGTVIATADNKLAAIDHYVERGNLDELEEFVRTGKTRWLTADRREQFELTTFTPASLRRLFEKSGFEVVEIVGKPVVPVRQNKRLLESDDAGGEGVSPSTPHSRISWARRPRHAVERLIQLEMELSKDPAAAARATHLQIVARKTD